LRREAVAKTPVGLNPSVLVLGNFMGISWGDCRKVYPYSPLLAILKFFPVIATQSESSLEPTKLPCLTEVSLLVNAPVPSSRFGSISTAEGGVRFVVDLCSWRPSLGAWNRGDEQHQPNLADRAGMSLPWFTLLLQRFRRERFRFGQCPL